MNFVSVVLRRLLIAIWWAFIWILLIVAIPVDIVRDVLIKRKIGLKDKLYVIKSICNDWNEATIDVWNSLTDE